MTYGPLGHATLRAQPWEVRIGDLVEFDGLYYPVQSTEARNGMTTLRFIAHPPFTFDCPIYVWRPVTHEGKAAGVRAYSLNPTTPR
ncbi:hypothetical protein C6N75_10075 [Streptomyces solincola]|uniref:Uncharacterized protein n=1 Tax=Streptomyces solincola TaxID=2100817 RepID=A0A2S9PYC4_9ACTN|nr:hypothetical protein [Streptomyces solincola]PRH79418.1 hypothetical protein C6N75_10075 [Streptomyces solincola]